MHLIASYLREIIGSTGLVFVSGLLSHMHVSAPSSHLQDSFFHACACDALAFQIQSIRSYAADDSSWALDWTVSPDPRVHVQWLHPADRVQARTRPGGRFGRKQILAAQQGLCRQHGVHKTVRFYLILRLASKSRELSVTAPTAPLNRSTDRGDVFFPLCLASINLLLTCSESLIVDLVLGTDQRDISA